MRNKLGAMRPSSGEEASSGSASWVMVKASIWFWQNRDVLSKVTDGTEVEVQAEGE
jgi:hypothetical protein